MQYSKSPVLAKLAAVAAALAVSGAAFAATPAATSAPAASAATGQGAVAAASDKVTSGHWAKRMRHHHASAMWVPGYGPAGDELVKSLSLTDSQAKLLADAQTTQKQLRQEQRDSMKAARSTRMEQLKAGKIDPHAALKASDEIHQKVYEERQKLNQKWLAVWDSLDATQQQKLAAHFSARAEKRAQHAKSDANKDQRGYHRDSSEATKAAS